MTIGWVVLVAALLTGVAALIQMGRNLDKEDDPKTKERRKQLGKWLSGQGERTLVSRLQTTSETFLDLFDRILGGNASLIERGLWTGLLLSPAFLIVVAAIALLLDENLELTTVLLSAMSLAFGLALGVAIGRRSPLVGIVLVIGIGIGIGTGIDIDMIRGLGLGIGIGLGIGASTGDVIVVGISIVIVMVIGIVTGTGDFIVVGISIVIVIEYLFFSRDVRIPVHPLKALGSSLIFILIVGSISAIRADAA